MAAGIIKYRTFEQLMADVSVDFQNYSLQNMIEPQQLIKVAKRVNYDLGLRIMSTKGALLEVEKSKVKLPDDFYVLNYATICDEVTVEQILPQGTNIQSIPIPNYQETPMEISSCTDGTVNCTKCNLQVCSCTTTPLSASCSTTQYDPANPYGSYCTKPRVFMDCKNNCYELVQIVNARKETFKRIIPIRMLVNPDFIDCNCPNLNVHSDYVGWIKDGFLYTNFDCDRVFISYEGQLEDEEGNLLVPDHALLNEYYEYAVKKRILENLIMNDEVVNQMKIQMIETNYKIARTNALSMVNMPNFAELKQVFDMNRKAQYSKYYNMFASYAPLELASKIYKPTTHNTSNYAR